MAEMTPLESMTRQEGDAAVPLARLIAPRLKAGKGTVTVGSP
jgi:hypothetical protein